MSREELEPLQPDEALSMYLNERKSEGVSPQTIDSHRSRLSFFIDWCHQEEIHNLNDLSGRDCHRFKLWRQNTNDLSKATIKTQIDTLRVFIKFCASIDGVHHGLPDKIQSPSLKKGENSRDVMVAPEAADAIEERLQKYRYGSMWHAYVVLLRTGLRVGAIRSLDLSDYYQDEQALELHHRPDTGTPIKNATEGERYVSIDASTCTVLSDYIDDQRHVVVDEHGREPLLSTSQGRPHIQTLRNLSYRLTRPCWYSEECPHDREVSECRAAHESAAREHECPSSKSPHPWRRLTITQMLRNDAPAELVGDRCSVSKRVIDEHYDERDEQEKMEARREWFDSLQSRNDEDEEGAAPATRSND